jgi:hypothetical protein
MDYRLWTVVESVFSILLIMSHNYCAAAVHSHTSHCGTKGHPQAVRKKYSNRLSKGDGMGVVDKIR